MNWGDEHYVKLYTRDTPTWKALPWQARALWPLLMRKLDGAGLMECGELGRGAVGLMVEMPEDVCSVGLDGLERHGIIVWHDNTLEAPKFLDAQEARKSDVLRKREERQKAKDRARADAALAQPRANTNDLSHDVRKRPNLSLSCPALPSPALVGAAEKPAGAVDLFGGILFAGPEASDRKAKGSEAPSPQWQQTVAALHEIFLELRGKPYRFAGNKDGPALKRMLKHSSQEEICLRFRRGLSLPFNPVNGIAQLDSRWNDLAAECSPSRSTPRVRRIAASDHPVEPKSYDTL